MSVEQGNGYSPFRVEIRPAVRGADPYSENPREPRFGGLNHRAILLEIVHLYEGDPRAVKQGETSLQVRAFMNISRDFLPDRSYVNQWMVHYGLEDLTTNRPLRGYSDSNNCSDPLEEYRITQALEALPRLNPNEKSYEFCSVATAASRVFYGFEIREEGRKMVIQRRKVAKLIGKAKLREILGMFPPNLEEMMQAIKERLVWSPRTLTLERDIRTKQIFPSEFMVDMMAAKRKDIKDLARGLEETGGAW